MKQTAQGLAALGRGPDTQLVHMTPGEVKSLQQLAMAGGGSLTINPATGLPEAGFLSSLLPTLIGAGLSFIPGVGPLMAAGIVGGLQTARTGSISKGLMAGLGAYGGAGLAGGLTAAGAASGAGATGAGMPELLGNAGAELAAQPATFSTNLAQAGQGLTALPTSEAARTAFMGNAASKGVEAAGVGGGKGLAMAGLGAISPMLMPETTTKQPEMKIDASMGQRYSYSPSATSPTPTPDVPEYGAQDQKFGREQNYFNPQYAKLSGEAARSMYGYANGGPVEAMSNANAIGASTGYPQSDIRTGAYSNPFQQPMGNNVVTGAQDAAVDPYTGQQQFAKGGGISNLGDYSDGGRLLRGPGDGVSDNIPAMIGKKQPARLADGEFVVPARIVSELGNGSTEAGARKLYAMMERVQKARGKTVGKGKIATNSRAAKHLPA